MHIPNRKSFAAILLVAPLLLLSFASAQCPGGSGTPITITNYKPGESVGHDLLLLKGSVAANSQNVTMTNGGESISWPAGAGVYKGFIRLKPGANKITVSSPGHQNACIDIAYAPNPYAAQVQLACLLPKDYVEGSPLFRAPAGEPADLPSLKKRLAFAGLMQQSLIAELLGKAGKPKLSPYFVRDAQGDPDVMVIRSSKTKAEMAQNDGGSVLFAVDPAVKPLLDGRTQYEIFYTTVPGVFNLSYGILSGLDDVYTWPHDLPELVSRWTDRRTPKELALPWALQDTMSLATKIKRDFGFWFKLGGLWALKVPNVDTVTADVFGKAYDKLNTLFLAKSETGADIPTDPYGLTEKSATGLAASPCLANPNPARIPALTAANIPAGLVQGSGYKYYEGAWDKLPDFTVLAPKASGLAAGFDIQNRTSDDNFAFVFDAFLKVPQAGNYLFQINSDDGSRMVLDNVTFIDNDSVHVDARRAKGAALEAGLHRIQIQYFNKLGSRGLTVQWAYAGVSLQPIPVSALQGAYVQSALLPRPGASANLLQRNRHSAVLTLARSRNVSLSWIDPAGRVQGYLFQGKLEAGTHEIRIPASPTSTRNALVLESRP